MGGLAIQENAPRRLSKPRTNTSSSNLLSTLSDHQSETTSSPANSPEVDYFGDHATVVSSQGTRRSRRKSRSKIRAYLYGSNEEAVQNSSEEDDGRNVLVGTARSVKKRLSRTGSSIMQLQSAKASTAYLSKSESQGSDAEESAMIAVQIKEKAHNDSMAALNHLSSPVDDNKHVDSVMAPVRRKSLYTPGIATRNPSDILRKPPPPDTLESQTDHDYYYNPARPETSPLSQLAALNLGEDGRATPSSIHYPQLGGLQLGTLRVTNGIPRNDTPDLLNHSPTPESKTREDYFTASEGSASGNHLGTFSSERLTPLQIQKELQEIFQPDDGNNTPREPLIIGKEKNDAAANMAYEYMAELDGSPFSETPLSRQRQDRDDAPDDEGVVMFQAESTATDKWRHLIDGAEVDHGGSSTTEDAFRKLNGNTPSLSETARLSVPSSMSSRYSISTEIPTMDSGYSSYSSMTASHMNPTNSDHEIKRSNKVLATLQRRSRYPSEPRERPDSISKQGDYAAQPTGPAPITYSPNVAPCHTLPRSSVELPSSPSSQTIDTVRPSARSSVRSSPNVARKLQKPRPKSQPPPVSSITVQRNRDLEQANIPRVPSVIAARHAHRLRQFPVFDHTFPSSQHTTAEDLFSTTTITPMPIRFPSPANALEAATSNLYTGPSLSNDNKIPRPRALSRYRSSMLLDGNESPRAAIVRSPSWSNFGGGRKKKEQKRSAKEEREKEKRLLREEKELAKRLEKDKKDLEKQIKKDESKQRASRCHSASRTRARSSDRQPCHQDTLTTIADFGTVTESLGRSPYDITTSMFSSASQNASKKHAHQIGTPMSRPRSMICMDETAAAEASRARGRARSQSIGRSSQHTEGFSSGDGGVSGRRPRPQSLVNDVPPVPALAAVDIRAHNLEWARNRRKSQSFSAAKHETDGLFNDRGGIPGRSLKPSSIIVDAPPVPALPAIQQVEQQEVRITGSRPQSMIIDGSSAEAAILPHIDRTESQSDELADPGLGTLTPLEKKSSKLVPELWSKGSLEKKSPKAVHRLRMECDGNEVSPKENQSDKVSCAWEEQREAWYQRRKSASEALVKTRMSQDFAIRPVDSDKTYVHEQNNHQSSTLKVPTAEPQYAHEPKQSSRFNPSPLVSTPSPVSTHPQLSPQQQLYKPESNSTPYTSSRPASYHQPVSRQYTRPGPSPLSTAPIRQTQDRAQIPSQAQRRAHTQDLFPIPRKRVNSADFSPTTKIENLTGRYAGGLMYGYEPGCGLGGSAGTRSAKTEASRKSVDVSKGFGIDLSDVPIFVASTSAKRN